MDNLAHRFRYSREKKGFSQLALAEALGVSQQAIQQVESGKARKPRYLYEAANLLETTYEWLLFGEGTQSYTAANSMQAPFGQVHDSVAGSAAAQMPVLELLPGGGGDRYYLSGATADTIQRPRQLDGVEKAYAVYVYDSYMEPRYMPGEVVFMHPSKPVAVGDFVAVRLRPRDMTKKDELSLVRFEGREENAYVFSVLNPARRVKIEASRVVATHKIVLAQQF